jgi:hypothetical protein
MYRLGLPLIEWEKLQLSEQNSGATEHWSGIIIQQILQFRAENYLKTNY